MHRHGWLSRFFLSAFAACSAIFTYILRPVADFAESVWRLAFPADRAWFEREADLPSEVSYSTPLRSRAAAFIGRRLQHSSTHAAPSLGVGLAGAYITG